MRSYARHNGAWTTTKSANIGFGSGEGFTADAIVTGFLSADRIEARSITVDKISSTFGAEIDLSKNESITTVVEAIGNQRTEINQMANQIASKVSSKQYNEDLNKKADIDWVSQQKETILQQTDENIKFQFNQTKEYVKDSTAPLEAFKETVESYQKFSPEGLEIGEIGSPFKMKLSKNKLSFLQDGQEVAYVSNNRMHITEARVAEKLSVGTENNGYFDWTTLPTGMALKWRG